MTASTTRFPISRRRPRSYSSDSEISVQPIKPNQFVKPKLEIRSKKVSVLSESNAFPVTESSQSRNGPLGTSSNSIPSIFVQKTFDENCNDNWSLKRSSPVYDSDDDDLIIMSSSPSKKPRTSNLTLDWGNRLPDESSGFGIKL
ncbi:MAG: hypothetical protein SGBAC_001080 [Bacillariaceae sp.]